MGFVELLLIAAEGFDFFSLFNRGLGLKAFIGGLRVRSVGCEAVEGLGVYWRCWVSGSTISGRILDSKGRSTRTNPARGEAAVQPHASDSDADLGGEHNFWTHLSRSAAATARALMC